MISLRFNFEKKGESPLPDQRALVLIVLDGWGVNPRKEGNANMAEALFLLGTMILPIRF